MITLIGNDGNVDFTNEGLRVQDPENTDYPEILRIDIIEWEQHYAPEKPVDTAWDILDWGYWLNSGEYSKPCTAHREYCAECNGTKEIEVLYENMPGYGYSNEQAERLAGAVHHKEPCPYCGGTGLANHELP